MNHQALCSLPTPNEVDDLDLVTLFDCCRIIDGALHDHEIVFHRDTTGVDIE